MATMKRPSMLLAHKFIPVLTRSSPWAAARGWQQAQQRPAQFSTTQPRQKRSKEKTKDPRVTAIRYHLYHPLTPRPLRFSRNRHLRHWTIHRAWMRYQDKVRQERQLELERQYNSMAAACEALRMIDGDGLTEAEREKLGVARAPGSSGASRDLGRLYRIAMRKEDIWEGVPIEYARIQTETPAREGWNHAWKRG